jgi:hypothetical protein
MEQVLGFSSRLLVTALAALALVAVALLIAVGVPTAATGVAGNGWHKNSDAPTAGNGWHKQGRVLAGNGWHKTTTGNGWH